MGERTTIPLKVMQLSSSLSSSSTSSSPPPCLREQRPLQKQCYRCANGRLGPCFLGWIGSPDDDDNDDDDNDDDDDDDNKNDDDDEDI